MIIGLDGFTWVIGDKLIRENYMPTLRSLVKNGSHGILKSVIPFETSPAWSSFQTGCFPPKTGIFAFHSIDPLYENIILNSFNQISVPSIWEIASKADKKVISVNMPMTSPPPRINGVIVPGLTCPELSSRTVWPVEVYKRYLQKYQDYRVVNKDKQDSLRDYVQAAIQTEQVHCDLSLQLMADYDWDIFCLQVQSTDFFQHRNWWSLDSSASDYTEEAFKVAASFYTEVDNNIKRLMTAAGEGTLLCVVSDHGFCSKRAQFGINSWLLENGYFTLSSPAKQPFIENFKMWLKKKSKFVKSLTNLYGRQIQKEGRRKKDKLHAETVISHIREVIDLTNTEAFCLGGAAGLLYVNPSKSRNAQKIVNELLDQYGPASETPIIAEIRRTEEVYEISQRQACFPDYIILLAEGISNYIQPDGNIVIKKSISEKQGGTHDPNGIFLFSGTGTKSGVAGARIVDIAPTLLSYLGIPVPTHMEGTVLDDLFESALKPVYRDYDIFSSSSSGRYSNEEQSAVEQQLKDLGYL